MTTPGPSPVTSSPWSMGRPSEVRTSVWLWIAAIVLHVASLLAVYVAAASFTRGRSSSRVLGLGTPHVTFVIVTAAIGLALVIVMRRGRNWARITLTVLAVLNVVGTVGGLVFFLVVPVPSGVAVTLGGPVGIVIDILQTVCIVAGIVLVYRPRANAYFATARR